MKKKHIAALAGILLFAALFAVPHEEIPVVDSMITAIKERTLKTGDEIERLSGISVKSRALSEAEIEYHDLAEGAPTENLYKHWFVTPAFEAPKTFVAPSEIPIAFGESCSGRTIVHSSLPGLISSKFGYKAVKQFPTEMRATRFTQFWKRGDVFHQLSANLEYGEFEGYVLRHFVASDERLLADTQSVEVEGFKTGTTVPLTRALEIIQQNLEKDVALGGVVGARMMQIELMADGREELAEVSYLNAIPVGYVDGEFACRLEESLNKANCGCKPAGTRGH